MDDFRQWRHAYGDVSIGHVKGFSVNLSGDYYVSDVLDDLKHFDAIVFDGDSLCDTGFTKIVPMFLELGPQKRAIAFRSQDSLPEFKCAWSCLDQIAVVAVNLEVARSECAVELRGFVAAGYPEHVLNYFVLGRAALVATKSRTVVSLGGGIVPYCEAEASKGSDVHWTVYAQSRDKKEERLSLMDWAAANPGPQVKLVVGKDPREDYVFSQR